MENQCAHVWGEVEFSRFAGNPHKKCTKCRFVSLDLDECEEVEEEIECEECGLIDGEHEEDCHIGYQEKIENFDGVDYD